MPYLRLPDNNLVEVSDGVSYADALERAKLKFPKSFANTKKAEEGLLPSVQSALVGFMGAQNTGLGALMGRSDDKLRQNAAQVQARQSEISKETSWDDVEKAWDDNGLFGGPKEEQRGALGQAYRFGRSQLANSLPYMGATMAGARAGALAGGLTGNPIGVIGGGLVGGALSGFGAYTGNNLQRQMQEQEESGQQAPLDVKSAAIAAVPQAALDMVTPILVLGKLGVGSKLADALMKAPPAVKEHMLLAASKGAVKGIATEIPTELAQTVLERHQANLPLLTPDALKEYKETVAGTIAVGGPFGVAGGVSQQSGMRSKLEKDEQALVAKNALARAEEEKVLEARKAAAEEQRQEALRFGRMPQGTNGDLFGGQASLLPPRKTADQFGDELQGVINAAPIDPATGTRRLTPEQSDRAVAARQNQLWAGEGEDAQAMFAPRSQEERATKLKQEYDALVAQYDQAETAQQALRKASSPEDIAKHDAAVRSLKGLKSAIGALEKEAKGDPDKGIPAVDLSNAPNLATLESQIERARKSRTTELAPLFKQRDALVAQQRERETGVSPADADQGAQRSLFDPAYMENVQNKNRAAALGTAQEDARGRYERMQEQESLRAAANDFAADNPMAEVTPEVLVEPDLIGKQQERLDVLNRPPKEEIELTKAMRVAQRAESVLRSLTGKGGRLTTLKVLQQRVDEDIASLEEAAKDATGRGLDILNDKIAELQKRRAGIVKNIPAMERAVQTATRLVRKGAISDKRQLARIDKNEKAAGEPSVVPTTLAEKDLLAAADSGLKQGDVQPQQARFRANEASKRRKQALFDLANAIDAMRKGEFTGATKEGQQRKAEGLRRDLIDATLEEADMRRAEFGEPPLTTTQKLKAAEEIELMFQYKTEHAPSRTLKKTGPALFGETIDAQRGEREAGVSAALDAAARKRQMTVPQLLEALKEDKALRDDVNAEMRATLARAERLNPRGRSIKHGMSISGDGEFSQLKTSLGRLTYELSFPQKSTGKRKAAGEFSLVKQGPESRDAGAPMIRRALESGRVDEATAELLGQALKQKAAMPEALEVAQDILRGDKNPDVRALKEKLSLIAQVKTDGSAPFAAPDQPGAPTNSNYKRNGEVKETKPGGKQKPFKIKQEDRLQGDLFVEPGQEAEATQENEERTAQENEARSKAALARAKAAATAAGLDHRDPLTKRAVAEDAATVELLPKQPSMIVALRRSTVEKFQQFRASMRGMYDAALQRFVQERVSDAELVRTREALTKARADAQRVYYEQLAATVKSLTGVDINEQALRDSGFDTSSDDFRRRFTEAVDAAFVLTPPQKEDKTRNAERAEAKREKADADIKDRVRQLMKEQGLGDDSAVFSKMVDDLAAALERSGFSTTSVEDFADWSGTKAAAKALATLKSLEDRLSSYEEQLLKANALALAAAKDSVFVVGGRPPATAESLRALSEQLRRASQMRAALEEASDRAAEAESKKRDAEAAVTEQIAETAKLFDGALNHAREALKLAEARASADFWTELGDYNKFGFDGNDPLYTRAIAKLRNIIRAEYDVPALKKALNAARKPEALAKLRLENEALQKAYAEFKVWAKEAEKAKSAAQVAQNTAKVAERMQAAKDAVRRAEDAEAKAKASFVQALSKAVNSIPTSRIVRHERVQVKASRVTPARRARLQKAEAAIAKRLDAAVEKEDIADLRERLRTVKELLNEQQAIDDVVETQDNIKELSRVIADIKAEAKNATGAAKTKLLSRAGGLQEELDTLKRQRTVAKRVVEDVLQTSEEPVSDLQDRLKDSLLREYREFEGVIRKRDKYLADANAAAAQIEANNKEHDKLKAAKPKGKAAQRMLALWQKRMDALDAKQDAASAAYDEAAGVVDAIDNLLERAEKLDFDVVAAAKMRDTPLKTAKANQKTSRELYTAADRTKKNSPAMLTPSQERPFTPLQEGRTVQRPDSDASVYPSGNDYRLATEADTGVDAGEAQAVADRIQKKLPKGIKLVYAPTLEQAPQEFKDALKATGRTAAKGAVLPDGTVAVIGEAHATTADLEATFAHELLGHHGVDTLIGAEGVRALSDKLWARGDEHVAEVGTALGVFPDIGAARAAVKLASTPELKTTFTREMIAHAAEGRKVSPKFADKVAQFIKDMVASVRAFFRAAGMSSAANADTKDIQRIIKDAYKQYGGGEVGAYVSPDGTVAFRSKPVMPAGFTNSESFAKDGISQTQGLADTVRANGFALTAKTYLVDQLAPIEAFGQVKEFTDRNAFHQMMYNHQKSVDMTTMAATAAQHGVLEWVEENGERRIQSKEDGPSLKKVDDALKGLLDLGFNADGANQIFTAYMAALRGAHEGFAKLNYSPKIEDMARRVLPEVDANKPVKDVLNAARAEYNAYNKGLVDFLESSGAVTKELANTLRAKKDYIPYYRVDGGVMNMMVGGERVMRLGDLRNQPYLDKLVGGDKPIMDYFSSSMQNTMLLTDMALRNAAAKQTALALAPLGVAKINKSTNLEGKNVLHFKVDGEDRSAIINTENTPFAGIPSEMVARAMDGMSMVIPDWLRVMALPSQLLRKGIVYNPLYPWTQLFKDSLSMGASRGGSMSNMLNVWRGVNNYVHGKDIATQLQRRGMVQGQMYTGTVEDIAITRRQMTQQEGLMSKAIAAQESRNIQADAATRMMLFNQYRKQGLSERDAEYMALNAMPYNRRGLSPGMRYLSMMIPFFNAQVVGLHSLYQAATGKHAFSDKLKFQKNLFSAGMMMGISTLAYAAMVSDEDWYKNLPAETRLRNWLIKLPGVEEPLAIPIPFEYGIMFKSLFEATATGMFDSTPEGAQLRKAMKMMVLQSIPGGVIPLEGVPVLGALPAGPMAAAALRPVMELVANKSFFSDAPIETTGDLAIDADKRAHTNTTELAKTLGAHTGLSPLQIDHLIRGYTGTLGAGVASLVGATLTDPNAPAKPESPLSRTPFLSQFFKPVDGNAAIEAAIETLRPYAQRAKTYEAELKKGNIKEADRYYAQHELEIERGKLAGQLRQTLGELKQYEMSIRANRELSPKQMREELKGLQQYRIQAARDIMASASAR